MTEIVGIERGVFEGKMDHGSRATDRGFLAKKACVSRLRQVSR